MAAFVPGYVTTTASNSSASSGHCSMSCYSSSDSGLVCTACGDQAHPLSRLEGSIRHILHITSGCWQMRALRYRVKLSTGVPRQGTCLLVAGKLCPKQQSLNASCRAHAVAEYGNTSAASIPLALNGAVRDGRIKKGDVVSGRSAGQLSGAAHQPKGLWLPAHARRKHHDCLVCCIAGGNGWFRSWFDLGLGYCALGIETPCAAIATLLAVTWHGLLSNWHQSHFIRQVTVGASRCHHHLPAVCRFSPPVLCVYSPCTLQGSDEAKICIVTTAVSCECHL